VPDRQNVQLHWIRIDDVPHLFERVESVVYRTILCPIEFSDPSTRALEYALTLAQETGARLILLHVVEQLVDAPQTGARSRSP